MKNTRSFLEVEETRLSTGKFWLLVLIAYCFALAVRYIWVDWASQFPQFYWNGQIMINTNDGYYWAEGARDMLAGHHQPNDLSPVGWPLSMLTAWLARVLPFSFETIILWMPAVFGSLLVVPIMLIARALRQDWMGFLAALLGGIVWSYYNRTMVGYYDTDMLTIVLPTFILWATIMAVLRKQNRWMVLTALLMILYQWWYPSAQPLNTAMTAMVLFYTLVFEIWERYNYKLLLFMLTAVLPLAWEYQLGAALVLYLFFHFGKERADRYIAPLLGIAALLFILLGGLNPIWFQIKGYVLRESTVNGDVAQKLNLHFFAVSKTVREAGKIPFEIFADRISGHPVLFILSLIGYLMLALRYRVMWLALPMLGLGFLAMKAGLRFTVYAVPPMALGMGYLVLWFSQRVARTVVTDESRAKQAAGVVSLILLGGVLYPNIRHVINYKVPTVFNKQEVEALHKLHGIAKREDYVLGWWDYGYPIRYYSDVKTLVDGGKHSGDVNFPVSFALSMPQAASANMARLDVEYTEKAYKKHLKDPYLELMMKDYGYKDPSRFLQSLDDKNLSLPTKTRDVYYYLPERMMGIFPTVTMFSVLDLKTGRLSYHPIFMIFRVFKDTSRRLYLGPNIYLDKETGQMYQGNKAVSLGDFSVAQLRKDGTIEVKTQHLNPSSPLHLIYMKSYGRFLLLDDRMYHSAYIQMFVLGHADPDLFEPVILNPYVRIYRLKR
jgi:dolichyl-diphosphooligosaccharide--protein glycosyltransferase/undecaprenyl-diphosphooligosaccharide--protein glycosyltransferase